MQDIGELSRDATSAAADRSLRAHMTACGFTSPCAFVAAMRERLGSSATLLEIKGWMDKNDPTATKPFLRGSTV